MCFTFHGQVKVGEALGAQRKWPLRPFWWTGKKEREKERKKQFLYTWIDVTAEADVDVMSSDISKHQWAWVRLHYENVCGVKGPVDTLSF